MTYKNYKKWTFWAFLILPLIFHFFQTYIYAYGKYDGKHCAGLLDAVWECTEFEYYFDYMTNFFALTSLAVSYIVAFGIFLVLFLIGKIFFYQRNKNKTT